MPFNGSGVYSAPSLPGSWNPAIAGQTATPSDWNELLADFVNAFDLQICRDGQSTITADIPFAGFKLTHVGNATLVTDAVNAGQILSNGLTAADDTGAANAYVIAPTVGITAYAAYQWFQFKAANANTTVSTLNVSSLGAKTIKRPNGDDLVANDILAGALCDVMYDGTNFILLDGGSNAINYSLLTTRGDLIARGASAPQRLALGTNGQALISNGTDPVFGVPAVRSYLTGLTLSTAGSSATFGIAVGIACDSTAVAMMALASAYTKTASTWAVGSGNGSLDTGAIANTTSYHVWLIQRPDTGVVDVLTSLSATSPTMPTNYTLKRRIGSMKTDGSAQWVAFVQDGDLFQWLTFVASNSTDPGTGAVSRTLGVPTGINVQAQIQPIFINLSTGGPSFVRLSDLATTDTLPSASNSDMPGANNGSGQLSLSASVMYVRTNTSAQIRARLSYSDGSVSLNINTLGWIDRRGRDA